MAILYGSLAIGGNDNFNDALFGTSGHDFIYGLGGNDHLFGNAGNDYIDGGKGADVLYGGPGSDKFAFKLGESTLTNPDKIGDFVHFNWNSYASGDHIDAAVPGSASNYLEGTLRSDVGWGDFDPGTMFLLAKLDQNRLDAKYVFATNGQDGFLVADLDGDGYADAAVILQGLKSVNDFDYHDII